VRLVHRQKYTWIKMHDRASQHKNEIRRRHTAFAIGQYFYLFRAGRMGGCGAHWHAGGGAVWQKENVHGGGVSGAYRYANHLRSQRHCVFVG